MKTAKVSSNSVVSNLRFDGKFHLSDGLKVRQMIKKSPYGNSRIGDVTSDIYCPGIFRRNYTNSGIPFLGGGDIKKAHLGGGKYLMAKTTPNYEILQIKKGWTLVTCGGTIGDTVFSNNLLAKCWISQHVMRVIPSSIKEGMLFSYLASKYGHLLLTTNTYGSVIPTLNADNISSLPIPNFPEDFQESVDGLVQDAACLREEASDELVSAEKILKEKSGLRKLTSDDYDYYGHRSNQRKVSCFTRNIQDIGTTTINAFNHSERIRGLKASMTCPTIPLKDALKGGRTYGTSGLPNIEVKPGRGIMLINQKDMFDNIVKGKWISSRGSDPENVLEYGEILIACDGTLGENELFCRAVFANEDLKGSYVSSHFLRLKVDGEIPAGYLFCWLNSDYGFRFIRNTQAGTKLCHPINKLFLEIPVPVIDDVDMLRIDEMVRSAYTKRHQANQKELKAISMVEQEIEKWNN